MSNDMEFLSPLRYPGGKAKVSDFVQCLIKENALLDGIYVAVSYTHLINILSSINFLYLC